jgi:hypothetical protein
MRFTPSILILNASMNQNLFSNGIDLNQVYTFSIQAVWTGSTAAGSLFLQISDDIVPEEQPFSNPSANVVNWSTYTGSSTPVAGPGNFLWNVVTSGFRWVRLAYTFTSGTGNLTAVYSGKGQ